MLKANASTNARVEVTNAYMRGVYRWMTLGLAVTAALAFTVVSSEQLIELLFTNSFLLIGLLVVEVGLVMGITAGINRMSGTTASGLFLLYSALNGITLSAILLVYTQAAVFQAFVTTAGMFLAMSVYGSVTKRDLTGMGSFLTMGLFGLIIASIVNIFMQSTMMEFIISAVGVLIFTGLTAYDTQKLKAFGESAPLNDATAMQRGTILGALTLYLDFINLFIMMLRLFGSSRD
ncbi:MAG: Bax inhibitor-1/YccA family protein [Pseudomonadota bacterium]